MQPNLPLPTAEQNELPPEIVRGIQSYFVIHNKIGDMTRVITHNWNPFYKRARTRSGFIVNIEELNHRMNAIRYKLSYVSTSMVMLQRIEGDYRDRVESAQNMNAFEDVHTQHLGFYNDTFLTFLGSALDSGAWVIRLSQAVRLSPKKVSFQNVVNELQAVTLTVKKYKRFFDRCKKEMKEKRWLHRFLRYRNYVVHYGNLRLTNRLENAQDPPNRQFFAFLMPDDPDSVPPRYTRKIELVEYCQDVFTKILKLIVTMLEFAYSSLRQAKVIKSRAVRRRTATHFSFSITQPRGD